MKPSINPMAQADLKAFWRQDLLAGLLVFLLALPLSLGIAVASGFPPMAGIISAIVGGLLVSRLNSSRLTISGPAAGMIVVILASVQSLGNGDALAGYRYTLAAIVLSGLMQVGLAQLKAGRLAVFFPASVVHGMLAAIGVIIISKQLPVMLGLQIHADSILQGIALLPQALSYFVPKVALIAWLGLLLLLAWPHFNGGALSKIPAPILVILSGIVLGHGFDLSHFASESWFKPPQRVSVAEVLLVTIPDSLSASLVAPDFGMWATMDFWNSVLAITLVGSLETLISVAAVDKLAPQAQKTDLNQELKAIGIGNMVAGAIGGLPMIAEIVRSSANIDAGGQSNWANFFHGVWLLLLVLLFPQWISSIPLASLAALLVYTGWRLASPKVFKASLALGKEQVALMVITLVAVLASNLVLGVMVGMVAKLLLLVFQGVPVRSVLNLSYQLQAIASNQWRLQLRGAVVFSNVLALDAQLAKLPVAAQLQIDLSQVDFIDHSVMVLINRLVADYASNGGQCEIVGGQGLHSSVDHELATRRRSI